MYLRSILNSGDVSVPVLSSPLKNEFTRPLPLKPVHVHLARQRAVRRAGAEGLAGGFPRAVVLAFEVGDEDVVAGTNGCASKRASR